MRLPVSELMGLDLPEWYIQERETEKTIQRLNSIKEIDFYLRNPDEYIRRLAILRLQKLPGKDSVYLLKEVLDDPVESAENKYLAAWVIKSLSSNWEDDFLLTSGHFAYYNVYQGSYEELFCVRQKKSNKTVQFNFALSPSYSALQFDSGECNYEKDVVFTAKFNFREWYSLLGKKMAGELRKALCNFPKLIAKLPTAIGRTVCFRFKEFHAYIIKKHRNKDISTQYRNKTVKPDSGNVCNDYTDLRDLLYKEISRKPGALERLKKAAFQMLYVIFSPWRFFRKHKLSAAAFLLAVFLLMANTGYGRAFTEKYMNVNLKQFQDGSIEKVKEYSVFALDKFYGFLRIGSNGKNTQVDILDGANGQNSNNANGELYTVMAKDGLNIRKLPDPYSEKVGTETLNFGSTVTYLHKSQKDGSGRIWYNIRAKDGRTGWVSSVYLKELKKG